MDASAAPARTRACDLHLVNPLGLCMLPPPHRLLEAQREDVLHSAGPWARSRPWMRVGPPHRSLQAGEEGAKGVSVQALRGLVLVLVLCGALASLAVSLAV